MSQKTIFAVGNKFAEVSNSETILIFDELITRVRNKQLKAAVISVEQGISESQVNVLRELLLESDHHGQIKIMSYFDSYRRCDGALTHKVKPCNTLISDPQIVSDNTYCSVLLIDDECAELSDHVTGKHLQFMVLLEAARQMANAVTQKYYSSTAKMYLAETINVNFKAFAYPFRLDLECRVSQHNLRPTGDGKMAVEIDFRQNDKLIAQLTLPFSVLDRKLIAMMESTAIEALSSGDR